MLIMHGISVKLAVVTSIWLFQLLVSRTELLQLLLIHLLV